MTHKVRWCVSTNKGNTFYEEVEPFDGKELSPWLALQEYLTKNGEEITSLYLFHGDQHFNLPSAGKNPKFQEFSNIDKPLDYTVCRKMARKMSKDNVEIENLFTVAIAFYPNYQLQLWIDENNPKNSWVIVK